MTLQDKIKEIKLSFRVMMDGVVAGSMRDKGIDYRLNWGVTLPRLQAHAEELKRDLSLSDSQQNYQQDGQEHDNPFTAYDLAIALWKENVRECKILATLLMPPEKMLPEVCDIWMEQISSQEIAEQAAFNLWQYLPYAPAKAYQWIADEREYYQLCGFHVLSRLFMNGQCPNERGINEYLDQALAAMQSSQMAVRKAAMNSVLRFADLGIVYERMAKSAMKSANLDIF